LCTLNEIRALVLWDQGHPTLLLVMNLKAESVFDKNTFINGDLCT